MGIRKAFISLGLAKYQPEIEQLSLEHLKSLISEHYFDVVGEYYQERNLSKFAQGLYLITYIPTKFEGEFAVKVESNGLHLGWVARDDLSRFETIYNHSEMESLALINCGYDIKTAVQPLRPSDIEEQDCTDGKIRASIRINESRRLNWLNGTPVKKFGAYTTVKQQKENDALDAHFARMDACDSGYLWMVNGEHLECTRETYSAETAMLDSDSAIFDGDISTRELKVTKNLTAFKKLEEGFYEADFVPVYSLDLFKEDGEVADADVDISGMKVKINGKIFCEMDSNQAHELGESLPDETIIEFIEDLAYDGVSKRDIKAQAIFKVLLYKRGGLLGYVINHESAFTLEPDTVEAEFVKQTNNK